MALASSRRDDPGHYPTNPLFATEPLKGINIDRAGVAKIEGGHRQVSDIELVIIAEALGVTPGDLLRSAD